MFINSITMRNFRSHVNTDIGPLSRFNVFQGANNVGKTTILDAVYYALTGTCRGLDEGGRGSDALKTDNGSEGMSSIVLRTNEGEVGRAISQGPRSPIQAKIEKMIGAEAGMIKVLVSPMNFLSLMPKDQKEILTSVIGTQLKSSNLTQMMGDLARHIDLKLLTNSEGMDAVEKQFREKRPILKARIQDLEYVPREDLPKLPAFDGKNEVILEQASNELQVLRKERDQVIHDTAHAKAAFQSYETRKIELGQEIESVTSEMEELDSDRPSYVDKMEELSAEGEKRIAQEKQRDESKMAASNRVSQLEGKLEIIKEDVRAAVSLKAGVKCPSCKHVVTKSAQKLIVEDMKAEASKLNKDLHNQRVVLSEIQQLSITRTSDDVRNDYSAVQQALYHFDNNKKRLAYAQESLKNLGAPPTNEGDSTEEIDERIKNCEDFISALSEHIAEDKRKDDMSISKAAVQRELETCEKILKQIGPKGKIRLKLLGGGLDDLVQEVGKIAELFGLPGFNIQIEPFKILAKGRDAIMLSKSERIRLTLALAGVLAKRSKLGILCLDDSEALDGENQQLLPEVLDMCGLEQVFICGVSDDPKSQDVEDWSFFHVDMDEKGRSIVNDLTPATAA